MKELRIQVEEMFDSQIAWELGADYARNDPNGDRRKRFVDTVVALITQSNNTHKTWLDSGIQHLHHVISIAQEHGAEVAITKSIERYDELCAQRLKEQKDEES